MNACQTPIWALAERESLVTLQRAEVPLPHLGEGAVDHQDAVQAEGVRALRSGEILAGAVDLVVMAAVRELQELTPQRVEPGRRLRQQDLAGLDLGTLGVEARSLVA